MTKRRTISDVFTDAEKNGKRLGDHRSRARKKKEWEKKVSQAELLLKAAKEKWQEKNQRTGGGLTEKGLKECEKELHKLQRDVNAAKSWLEYWSYKEPVKFEPRIYISGSKQYESIIFELWLVQNLDKPDFVDGSFVSYITAQYADKIDQNGEDFDLNKAVKKYGLPGSIATEAKRLNGRCRARTGTRTALVSYNPPAIKVPSINMLAALADVEATKLTAWKKAKNKIHRDTGGQTRNARSLLKHVSEDEVRRLIDVCKEWHGFSAPEASALDKLLMGLVTTMNKRRWSVPQLARECHVPEKTIQSWLNENVSKRALPNTLLLLSCLSALGGKVEASYN